VLGTKWSSSVPKVIRLLEHLKHVSSQKLLQFLSHLVEQYRDCRRWVISLVGLVLLLSGISVCTHRPQGVIIVGIYMASYIHYLLLLYLSRKELSRRIGVQTSNRNFFRQTFTVRLSTPTRLHHFSPLV